MCVPEWNTWHMLACWNVNMATLIMAQLENQTEEEIACVFRRNVQYNYSHTPLWIYITEF